MRGLKIMVFIISCTADRCYFVGVIGVIGVMGVIGVICRSYRTITCIIVHCTRKRVKEISLSVVSWHC